MSEREERPRSHPVVRFIKRLFALVVILGILAGGGVVYGWHLFVKDGPLTAEKQIVIPKGANLAKIAETLSQAGVIDDTFVFTTWIRVLGTQARLRSGEYKFAARISAQGTMNQLINGQQIQRRITIPEGLTTYQVLERIRAAQGLEGELTETAGEGELLPDTYTYTLGETRNGIVQQMKRAMQNLLDEVWVQSELNGVLKDKKDLVNLASIVEKETSDPSERPMVAAVFINRLKKGMRLETNASVIYGITEGKASTLGRRVLNSDLEHPSPYNSYKNRGLPPGPIANPGKAAILATLKPDKNNYIYFVSDCISRGHVFAETKEQHDRNVAKYFQLRRDRGCLQ